MILHLHQMGGCSLTCKHSATPHPHDPAGLGSLTLYVLPQWSIPWVWTLMKNLDEAVRNFFFQAGRNLIFLTWPSALAISCDSKQAACFSSVAALDHEQSSSGGLTLWSWPHYWERQILLLINREPSSCVWGEGGQRRMSRLFHSRSLMRDSWDISVCPQCECTEGGPMLEQWEPWQGRLGQDLCKTFFRFQFEWVPRKCQVQTNPKFYNVAQPRLLRFTWFWVKSVQSTLRFIW